MDVRFRQLERAYLNGDLDAGVSYLRALIRSGKVPANFVELAAVYEHPVAMALTGREPSSEKGKRPGERDVLPIDRDDIDDLEDWPCEVYIRRLHAVASVAYEEVAANLPLHEILRNRLEEALGIVIDVLEDKIPHDRDYARGLFSELMGGTQDFLNYAEPGHRAIYQLLLAVSASLKSLDCDNKMGVISESGPAWACASLAHIEDFLGLRDPSLPESVANGFGPNALEKAYIAIGDALCPWLLSPFPA